MKVFTPQGIYKTLKIKPIDWNKRSKSNLQTKCKRILYQVWNGDVVGEEVRMPGARLYFDFLNANRKIIVEVQGEQHYKYNQFFHRKNILEFGASLDRDETKRDFARRNNFQFIEVKSSAQLAQVLMEMQHGNITQN